MGVLDILLMAGLFLGLLVCSYWMVKGRTDGVVVAAGACGFVLLMFYLACATMGAPWHGGWHW